ncbi:MAG TPA: cyclic nucleotide-binding domain-containing protein [Pirellulales bacterium]|jgi:CRP-like cAMP-binding protein|nr:cyclic nucleotide-binding domain-containing protein [Pirellulales bacterium]
MITDILPDKLLQDIPLFRMLNPTERRQIAEIIKVTAFQPGDLILEQGKESRNLWVVVEGKCEVVRHLEHKDSEMESVVLATLEPYHQFGEMSFFHPAPHSADVRAQTHVKLLRIAHVDYQDLIDEGIWAAYKISHTAVETLAQRLRRMDEWIAQLVADQPDGDDQVREWNTFREKLFNRWNL